jgi:hypothetical protein
MDSQGPQDLNALADTHSTNPPNNVKSPHARMDLHLVQAPNNAKDQQQHRQHAQMAVPPPAQHAPEQQPMSPQHAQKVSLALAAPVLVQDQYKGYLEHARLL